MKEVINLAGPSVKLVDSAIPRLNDDQVLIKVVVSGSNPKDWKVPDVAASGKSNLEMMLKAKKELNQGDDIAGVVEKVGSNLVEFKQSVAPSGQIDFTLPNDLDVSPAIKSITSVGSLGRGLGVEEALRDLKAGKASATKYVFRIADTPGIV
ncbi:hypothetical protein N7444_010691 [Penicillium canescens]|nr:hypothetical protein N7444_010691 [Penicillium canescens]